MWWTNGYSVVTDEIARSMDFKWIQDFIYKDTGMVICKDTFEVFDWRPIVEMPHRTPEEVLALLYVQKNEISDRFYPR